MFGWQGSKLACSLPHYRKRNTDLQRGDGTFEKSIEALRRLKPQEVRALLFAARGEFERAERHVTLAREHRVVQESAMTEIFVTYGSAHLALVRSDPQTAVTLLRLLSLFAAAPIPLKVLDPDAIAQTYLHLHRQHRSAWTWEVELRPWVERF